jgi:hypothetical protein
MATERAFANERLRNATNRTTNPRIFSFKTFFQNQVQRQAASETPTEWGDQTGLGPGHGSYGYAEDESHDGGHAAPPGPRDDICGGMMWGMGVAALLILVLLVLAIAALAKFLLSGG